MLRSSRARGGVAKVAVLALLVAGVTIAVHATAFAAVNCDAVFNGATPQNPIQKVASKTEAYAGQTVTFTISFVATGTDDNNVADCYRVDDGSNSALNALVSGNNSEKTSPNVGGAGATQTITFEITIPDDPSLIGHDIVDRAKATFGSVESRSDLVKVHVIPAPCTENCSTPTPPPPVVGTPTTTVKAVHLGATGSSSAFALALGLAALLGGIALTGVSIRRSKDEI
jgi:hypothetical protein